jgi:hypothetical protein
MSTRKTARQTANVFRGRIVRNVEVGYLLHLPKGYRRGSAKRWPTCSSTGPASEAAI